VSNLELAIHFLLQLAVILLACRLVGAVARRFGQPQVVAEMITGVLLGPSVFGLLWPQAQRWVFPWDTAQASRDTQSYLFPASQLGLALYMFVVGMEFRTDVIRRYFGASVAVSVAGMVTPFILGAILGVWFYQATALFPSQTSQSEAMIFLGASMCITAFPMLARIIQTQGLTGSRMGTVALGAGAIDDAAAWCLLAVVLASFDRNWMTAIRNIGGGCAYVVTAVFILRPVLAACQRFVLYEGKLTDTGLALALALMAAGACTTDSLGLHAVFGAFVMGAVMPRGPVVRDAVSRIQPLTVALLLPLFFTYSGLNTRITLLNSWPLWLACMSVLVVATLGKAMACTVAGLLVRLPIREAIGIGTLMNARGLMELIIINIGRERGIITDELFAILVIMAVVTTLAASPMFRWLVPASRSPDQGVAITGQPPVDALAD